MQVFKPVCNNYQASLQISQPTLQDLGLLFESTLYEDVYSMVMAGECGFLESIKYTVQTSGEDNYLNWSVISRHWSGVGCCYDTECLVQGIGTAFSSALGSFDASEPITTYSTSVEKSCVHSCLGFSLIPF
jgi:hypothetical protein